MNGFLAVFEDTVEFANPEYLMVVPLAALLLLFGGVIFAVWLGLRPVKTHGSSYPLFGHIKFWFLAILALVAVGTAAARPFWVYGGRSFKRGMSTSRSSSTGRRRCGSRIWARPGWSWPSGRR